MYTFKFVSIWNLLTYCTLQNLLYIHPHIEFCVQAWSPYCAMDVDSLEKIQHRATKLVPEVCNLPCEE